MIASGIIHISKILISKFDTQITKWLIKKLKNPLKVLKTNSSVQKSYLCGQILYVIIFLKETLSILNCHVPFILQINQAKTK